VLAEEVCRVGVARRCLGEAAAADVSSYSMVFTCVVGMVCVALSSPASMISDDEVAVTVPVSVVPSRIRMVACCPEACLFAHDATKKRVPSAAPARIVRHVRFGVYARPPDALNAVCFIRSEERRVGKECRYRGGAE